MSNYDKLQKSMDEPVKEYNQIKTLVELKINSITNLTSTNNIKSKNNLDVSTHKLREMMPHKKSNSKK